MGTLLTLFAVGLVAVLALGLLLSIVGAIFSLTLGIASCLLFKVAPVVFLGWVVLKLVDRGKSADRISAADRAWLEGGK